MAINIRKDGSLYLAQVVDDYNALIDAGLTTEKHRDKTSQQNGTDLIPSFLSKNQRLHYLPIVRA